MSLRKEDKQFGRFGDAIESLYDGERGFTEKNDWAELRVRQLFMGLPIAQRLAIEDVKYLIMDRSTSLSWDVRRFVHNEMRRGMLE